MQAIAGVERCHSVVQFDTPVIFVCVVVVDCFSWHARDSVFIPRSHPFSVGIPCSRRILVIVRVVVVLECFFMLSCLFDNSL
jgi:hypothetical protein